MGQRIMKIRTYLKTSDNKNIIYQNTYRILGEKQGSFPEKK